MPGKSKENHYNNVKTYEYYSFTPRQQWKPIGHHENYGKYPMSSKITKIVVLVPLEFTRER